ncbi:MAG: archease [Deltaproteobacteria bacterium]|nr:archease [Deltaproteobacteria bacterium]
MITDIQTIDVRDSRIISLEADQVEELMVHWLNELNFLFDTEGLLFAVFDITLIDNRHIEATVRGERYDPARHSIKTTVKSATYHQLEVLRSDDMWKARVIFDL